MPRVARAPPARCPPEAPAPADTQPAAHPRRRRNHHAPSRRPPRQPCWLWVLQDSRFWGDRTGVICPREWMETRSDATAGGGEGRRAVRGLTPRPSSSAAPAPALGHTCGGEGPGACAVALVKGLVDQVGPLLRGLERRGQHLPGAQHCLQSKSHSVCLLPLPQPTLQGPIGHQESRAFCGSVLSIPAAEGFRQSPH